MNRILIGCLLLLFLCFACGKQAKTDATQTSAATLSQLQGEWGNSTDAQWILTFQESRMMQVYGGDTVSTDAFSVRHTSCDTSYMSSSEKGLFLQLEDAEQTCLEITSLTPANLAYRESSTGQLHEFEKIE